MVRRRESSASPIARRLLFCGSTLTNTRVSRPMIAGDPLGVGDRRERDLAVGERPDFLLAECGAEERFALDTAHLQRRVLERTDADRARDLRGQSRSRAGARAAAPRSGAAAVRRCVRAAGRRR